MTALTDAENNLLTAARNVRSWERELEVADQEHDAAQDRLGNAEAAYAQAVVALTEARKALR